MLSSDSACRSNDASRTPSSSILANVIEVPMPVLSSFDKLEVMISTLLEMANYVLVYQFQELYALI